MPHQFHPIEQIGQGVLAIMPKPDQPPGLSRDMQHFAECGIQQIVSLLEPDEALHLGLQQEPEAATQQGLDFVSFPIVDASIPTSVEDFRDLTQKLYSDILCGKSTIVHCHGGIGRSGMVCAAVLIMAGYNPENAFKKISLKRGISVPETRQQRNWIIDNNHVISQPED